MLGAKKVREGRGGRTYKPWSMGRGLIGMNCEMVLVRYLGGAERDEGTYSTHFDGLKGMALGGGNLARFLSDGKWEY